MAFALTLIKGNENSVRFYVFEKIFKNILNHLFIKKIAPETLKQRPLAVCCGYALHTYGWLTIAKRQYPTIRFLLKNSTLYCFINAKTLTGQETTSLNTIIQKKNPNETNVSLGFLVRVTGLAVCFAYYSLVDQMTSIWCPTTRSN